MARILTRSVSERRRRSATSTSGSSFRITRCCLSAPFSRTCSARRSWRLPGAEAGADLTRARELLTAVGSSGSARSSALRAVGRRETARRARARADSQPARCCSATSQPATSIAPRPTTVAALLLELHAARATRSSLSSRTVGACRAVSGQVPDGRGRAAGAVNLRPARNRHCLNCQNAKVEFGHHGLAPCVRKFGNWRFWQAGQLSDDSERLVLRSATYHWRTNLAVCLGVAAAVSVLGGALLVGDSVRGSLRDLALSRLGRTGQVVSSTGFFREAIAARSCSRRRAAAAPLIATRGSSPTSHRAGGRRASSFTVSTSGSGGFTASSRATACSCRRRSRRSSAPPWRRPADAAAEAVGDSARIALRTQGRHRTDNAADVSGTLPPEQLGEFSLRPQQAEVRAVFAPLRRLQRDLGSAGRSTPCWSPAGRDADVERALRSA